SQHAANAKRKQGRAKRKGAPAGVVTVDRMRWDEQSGGNVVGASRGRSRSQVPEPPASRPLNGSRGPGELAGVLGSGPATAIAGFLGERSLAGGLPRTSQLNSGKWGSGRMPAVCYRFGERGT